MIYIEGIPEKNQRSVGEREREREREKSRRVKRNIDHRNKYRRQK